MKPEKFIERYIETNPHHPGAADVRLREYCVPVWALVGYWKAAEGDVGRVAADYRLPREAVEAAIAYYERNRTIIDARIAGNVA
jgi:uncharacterized protein (DUF433 family)